MGRQMARSINILSARKVETLTKPGLHGDGGGLYLQIKSKTASSNSNHSEDVAENDGQNVLDDLIPFFLNDDHDLLLQTHGLSLEFARVDGYKLGMALKPTSQSMTDIKKSITEQQQDDNNMISFQITMSLSQLFHNL